MTLPPFEHPHPAFGPSVGNNLEALKGLLDDLGAKRVFLVTGKHAYEAAPPESPPESSAESSAESNPGSPSEPPTESTPAAPKAVSISHRMEALLQGREQYRHWDFGVNPQLDDLMRGVAAYRAFNPDVLVAIGGGSVMDTAKLLPLLPPDVEGATAVLKGETTNLHRSCPFIAIPTTAGSGSEATQFSVVYIGIEKCTVDHPVLLPDSVILDPSLTYQLPPYLTATTGMDALSQAIESYWAKGATPESRTYAAQAIRTLLSAFPAVVGQPDGTNRKRMLEGSFLAGKAINISRTTAPHAVSYRLAQVYKIPHGHAVAMTLPTFFAYNLEVAEDSTAQALCGLLGCATVQAGKARLEQLMDEAGLKRRFTQLGATNQDDLDDLATSVNQHRLSNNPRPVDKATLHHLLEKLW